MKKKYLILFLGIIFSFNSCDTENEEPEIVDFSGIEDALEAIRVANLENKVIISYTINNGNYTFTFSDGSAPITVSESIISEIIENIDEWGLQITFIDDQVGNPNFIGSTIGISNTNITINPNNRTPLAALAEFATPIVGNIHIVVPGKGEDGITIEHTFNRDTDLYEIPVLGLYENYTNPVEFHFLDVSGNELTVDIVDIITANLSDIPEFSVINNSLPSDEDMVYMSVGLKHAFDQKGELRWALTNSTVHQFYDRMPNGNWVASSTVNPINWHFKSFYQIDMLGEIIKTYEVPNYGHHEIKIIGNGESIIVGTNSMPLVNGGIFDGAGTLQEDALVEISTETGAVVNTYDFNIMLDNTRLPIPAAWADDWFHNNSVEYDLGLDNTYGTDDDGIICSGRHQSAVFKFNKNSSTVQWIIGAHEEWPANLQQHLLMPVDASGNALDITNINFWPYGQHSAKLLPNGNLMLFDNGNSRGFYKTDTPLSINEYSRAIEYQIDEVNMTIQIVWEFDYDKMIYTNATGEIDYLSETNGRLISFMRDNSLSTGITTPRVVELDENSNVIFEYTLPPNSPTFQGYRTDKFDLYEGIE